MRAYYPWIARHSCWGSLSLCVPASVANIRNWRAELTDRAPSLFRNL
jgi:hypothetical protein